MSGDTDTSGLGPNLKRINILSVSPGVNLSWPTEDRNLNYTIPSDTWWPWCDYWKDPQHLLFQLANSCFAIAYASTCSKKGVLFMHCWLILGLMLFSTWAWNVICAPDVFTWNFAFMLLNMAQVFHILYQLRPVKFDSELEEVYHNLFYPFKVLGQMPEATTTEKVFHYLKNIPIACSKSKTKNVDPYEFEIQKTDDFNGISKLSCRIAKPGLVHERSLINEQMFENNVLSISLDNKDSCKKSQNRDEKIESDINNANETTQKPILTYELPLAEELISENTNTDKDKATTTLKKNFKKITILQDVRLAKSQKYGNMLSQKENFRNTDKPAEINKEAENIVLSDFEHDNRGSPELSNNSFSDTDYVPPTSTSSFSSEEADGGDIMSHNSKVEDLALCFIDKPAPSTSKVNRLQFKRMVSPEFAQIMSLHAGEAYAMQNLTRTDRLGLLLSGKVNALCDNQFLHPILPCEFLDSPEFESSRNTIDDKFKVSIVAASSCRYVFWQRSALEYLFVKETYLATVLTTLIAKDITTKLYAMNNKIVTAKGSHLDIRLPSITSSLTSGGEYKSPIRIKKNNIGGCPTSPDSFLSEKNREKFYQKFTENGLIPMNGRNLSEMEPLTELPSTDDLTSNDVESWLENSSKYHSCEIVDMD